MDVRDETPKTIEVTFSDPKGRAKRSGSLGKIGAALAKAQGEMLNAEKDVKGNYGKYATLASTWDAIRGPLSKNEIAIFQRPLTIEGKPTMCTMLIHSSGEFIDDSELEMIFDRTGGRITPMQAMGSAVTYSRRYTLQAACGVAPADDDDGAGAGKPPEQKPAAAQKPPPPAKPPAEKVGAPKQSPNFAPASKELMEEIYGLAMDKNVQESELVYLVTKGYGSSTNVPVTWIAKEIIELLKEDGANSATIMAQAARVQSRREAARIKDEASK